jgi:hypothetical protein
MAVMPPLLQSEVRASDSLVEVVRRYERHGFPSQFAARPGGNVRCVSCHRDFPARWVPLLALHRLEGDSDPEEEVVVAALECPACEERGTLALSFGPSAAIEDKLVLSLLDDRRGESVASIGLRVGL